MSEWASTVMLARKKDEKLRFCTEYRKLDSMTIRDEYPFPPMDKCIDTLGDIEYFRTLDAYYGYW